MEPLSRTLNTITCEIDSVKYQIIIIHRSPCQLQTPHRNSDAGTPAISKFTEHTDDLTILLQICRGLTLRPRNLILHL